MQDQTWVWDYRMGFDPMPDPMHQGLTYVCMQAICGYSHEK